MKIIFSVFLVTALLLTGNIFSQVPNISADRPGAGTTPVLMEKNYFQVEAGFTSENDEPVKDLKYNTLSLPTLLFRYGIAKNVELRAGLDVINKKIKENNASATSNGFGPLTAGTKIKLFTEKGSLPETAFLFTVSLPFKKDSEFQSDYIGSEFRLAMNNTLNKTFSLTYNLGGQWGAGNPGVTGLYTIGLGASVMKKLSAFVEIYGYLPEKFSPDHRIDGGLAYLLLKNIQADLSGGIGLSDKSPDYFISFGFSLRLPK
jgi:hypothetical protein